MRGAGEKQNCGSFDVDFSDHVHTEGPGCRNLSANREHGSGWFWISHLNNRVLSSSMRYCRGCGFARIAHQSSLRAQPKSRYSSAAPRRRTGPRIGSTICRLWDLCIRPFCDQVKLPKCSNFVVFFCFRTHSHAKQRPRRVVLTCGLQSYCRTEKLSPIRH